MTVRIAVTTGSSTEPNAVVDQAEHALGLVAAPQVGDRAGRHLVADRRQLSGLGSLAGRQRAVRTALRPRRSVRTGLRRPVVQHLKDVTLPPQRLLDRLGRERLQP
ncbi:hypothetical protein [Streptomyces sp. ID05-47C]|uniref:hypothetical protein n=1 Tax=Streptomyces sp. ID05-47C TaxID=3028665 RepID=UPI0029AD4CAC|nr:hypothetical protein [Streptomyces sp. ID05-47C]MDX3570381.1 hypothetical protein [Streptomyces sp. ID05-47C]